MLHHDAEKPSMQCPKCQHDLPKNSSFCDNCGTSLDPLLARAFADKYKLVRKLGEGGFGAVYEAEERKLSRKVAIKTLHAHVSKNPELARRFLQEAVATSRLEHPNIVKIYDFGETEDGIAWMAMEYLSGQPLDAYLREKRALSPSELIELMTPICEALGEAHHKGMVHRDLKPQNILLISLRDKLMPKVLDFGISKMEDSDSQTQTGLMMGTPQYMPPEQWDGASNATAASDVYALGVMMYQMLSGRFPFEANSQYSWMKKHNEEPPMPLESLLPSLGPLAAVVMRCLAKKSSERPADAFVLLAELKRAFQQSPQLVQTAALGMQSTQHHIAAQVNPQSHLQSVQETILPSNASCARCDIEHPKGSLQCPAAKIGRTISGKYKLLSLLGVGGMGAVYLAEHLSLKKQVALKMLLPYFASNEIVNKRFEEEARRASSLKHPGIVEVNDLGRDSDGTVYMEMELLRGKPVSDLLKDGELSIDQAVSLFADASEALSFAHQKGVIHRDLKPDNLFCVKNENGTFQIKIVDFGIAKSTDGEDVSMTKTGSIMGTPLYMSPEQATDTKRVDQRSDLYSLGATFYELLTRRQPISGNTLNELLMRLVEDRIERNPKKYRPDVPEWLDQVIFKTLAKDPQERFQSATELLQALRERTAPPITVRDKTLHDQNIQTQNTDKKNQSADNVQTLRVDKKSGTLLVGLVFTGILLSVGGYVLFPKNDIKRSESASATGATASVATQQALQPTETKRCTPATEALDKTTKGRALADNLSAESTADLCARALLQAKENAIRETLCIDEADAVTNPMPPIPKGCEEELSPILRALSWQAQIVAEKNVSSKVNTEGGGQSCEIEGTFRVLPLPETRSCEVEIVQVRSEMTQSLPPAPPEEYLFTVPQSSLRDESSLYIFTLLPGAQLYPMWQDKVQSRLIDRTSKSVTKFNELSAPLQKGFTTQINSYNQVPQGQLSSCEVLFAVSMPTDRALRVSLPDGKGEESKRLLALMSQISDSAKSMQDACWAFVPYRVSLSRE